MKTERLNLGSGWHYLDGFTNIDLYAERADLRADIRTVEFLPGTIDEVVCYHAIEHLTVDEGRNLIARVVRWLKPGGSFVIETPDRTRCVQQIRSGLKAADCVKGILGGRSGDKPKWAAYLKSIADNAAARGRLADSVEANPDTMKFVTATAPGFTTAAGEYHRHVWSEAELLCVARTVGLFARSEPPREHGGRVRRDCRIACAKPANGSDYGGI